MMRNLYNVKPMGKSNLLVAALVLTALTALYILRPQPLPETPPAQIKEVSETSTSSLPVDYTASFAIFTHGTFRIFTAAMYHNRSLDVYIEAANPNLVRVKKSGTTWQEFFDTLPFKLTSDCLTTGTKETFCTNQVNKLVFYLNGVKTNDALSREIKPQDQLLIHYGREDTQAIRQELEKLKSLTP